MRTLKKALCLVLVLAMVFTLAVPALAVDKASEYKDYSKVTNTEAVDVLTAIGVLNGNDDGTFGPEGNFTRAQAATIIAHMMLGSSASALLPAATGFSDVPATHWASGYIQYCVQQGIINGYGDGKFGPDDKLTSTQWALMLLGALGYSAKNEGIGGTGWEIGATSLAISAGVATAAELTAPFNRDMAAQLAFNTVKAPLVQYTNNGGSISVNGATVVLGASAAEYVTTTIAKEQTISKTTLSNTNKNTYTVEFGEKYFPELVLTADTDAFMRPSHTWTYGKKTVGTYVDADKLVAEYTTAVNGKTLYGDVGKVAFDEYEFSSYVDGAKSTMHEEISKNNNKNVSNTGNGALTQVFVDDEAEEVIVTVVNTYLAKAATDYSAKKDSVSLKVYSVDDAIGTKTASGERFAVEDLEEGDFVRVTYSKATKAIESVDAVETLADVTITSFSTTSKSLTADGTKYSYNVIKAYDALTAYTDGAVTNLKNRAYNVYFDQYGYVIGVEEVEATSNYVFITGVDANSSNLSTKNFDANAIFMDGTSKVITVKNNGKVEDAAVVNAWFTYTVSSSDVYTLTPVSTDNIIGTKTKAAQAFTDAKNNPVIDSKHITLKGADGTRVYGNDDSIYLLADLDKILADDGHYAVITGVDEVVTGVDNAAFELYTRAQARSAVKATVYPNSDTSANAANTSSGAYALYDNDGYVIAAVVVGESSTVSKNLAYVISGGVSSETYDAATGLWTWTRDVIIDGEKVELTEVNDSGVSALKELDQYDWFEVKYDGNGNVKKVVAATTEKTVQAAVAAIEKDDDDTIILQAKANHVYTLKGSTIYDLTDDKLGFRVASDVNVVLKQTVKNSPVTTYDEGVSALKATLEDLNEDGKDYEFNAVIKNGRAIAVIIIDKTADNDYNKPTGGNAGTVEKVTLDATGAISLIDEDGEAINGTGLAWELYMRGASQESFNVAIDGSDIAAEYTSVSTLMSGKTGCSFYIVIDGVKSNTVTVA